MCVIFFSQPLKTLNPTIGAYEAAMRTLLEEWDWDAILPCHGDIVKSGGKALLRRHLGRS